MKLIYFVLLLLSVTGVLFTTNHYFNSYYLYVLYSIGVIYIFMMIYLNYSLFKLKSKFEKEIEFLKYFSTKNLKTFKRIYSPFSIWDLNEENINLITDISTRKKIVFIKKLIIQFLLIFLLCVVVSSFMKIPNEGVPCFFRKHLPEIPKLR